MDWFELPGCSVTRSSNVTERHAWQLPTSRLVQFLRMRATLDAVHGCILPLKCMVHLYYCASWVPHPRIRTVLGEAEPGEMKLLTVEFSAEAMNGVSHC
jgi:hypothetical protein